MSIDTRGRLSIDTLLHLMQRDNELRSKLTPTDWETLDALHGRYRVRSSHAVRYASRMLMTALRVHCMRRAAVLRRGSSLIACASFAVGKRSTSS